MYRLYIDEQYIGRYVSRDEAWEALKHYDRYVYALEFDVHCTLFDERTGKTYHICHRTGFLEEMEDSAC